MPTDTAYLLINAPSPFLAAALRQFDARVLTTEGITAESIAQAHILWLHDLQPEIIQSATHPVYLTLHQPIALDEIKPWLPYLSLLVIFPANLPENTDLQSTLGTLRGVKGYLLMLQPDYGAWLFGERWVYRIASYAAGANPHASGAEQVFAAAFAVQINAHATPAKALQWAAAALRLKLDTEDDLPNTRAVTLFLRHAAPPLPVQQAEWGSPLAEAWLKDRQW
jgi:hypothetical protein